MCDCGKCDYCTHNHVPAAFVGVLIIAVMALLVLYAVCIYWKVL